ncbi:MAG: hypothetical protein WC054_02390 [Candidatus Nanopelagicales bacterium]
MILVWLLADVIPATDLAGDAAIWLGLVLSGVALLAAGRRIITGPLATEQQQMKQQLTELTKAVSHLAEAVSALVTKVAVIEDRQKRIAHKMEADDE